MNTPRFEEASLRPTYMSQAEANEVMELWAERQREEAARQSMITVHDVAEATQLPIQEVERLLQEVRTSRPTASIPARQAHAPAQTGAREPTLWEAYLRIAPASGLVTGAIVWYLHTHLITFGWGPGYSSLYRLYACLSFYTIVMALLYARRRFSIWYRTSPRIAAWRTAAQTNGFGAR